MAPLASGACSRRFPSPWFRSGRSCWTPRRRGSWREEEERKITRPEVSFFFLSLVLFFFSLSLFSGEGLESSGRISAAALRKKRRQTTKKNNNNNTCTQHFFFAPLIFFLSSTFFCPASHALLVPNHFTCPSPCKKTVPLRCRTVLVCVKKKSQQNGNERERNKKRETTTTAFFPFFSCFFPSSLVLFFTISKKKNKTPYSVQKGVESARVKETGSL